MEQLYKLLVFLNVLSFCHGFFAWESCASVVAGKYSIKILNFFDSTSIAIVKYTHKTNKLVIANHDDEVELETCEGASGSRFMCDSGTSSHQFEVVRAELRGGRNEWRTGKPSLFKPSDTTTKVLRAHGCEDEKAVVLSCSPGYKISILRAFFGHGHGHKSTCDNSWFGQNCGAIGASAKVKFLCQDKMTCTISPTSSVLGTTSCTFGLDSDLVVEYTCHKDLLRDTVSLKSFKIAPSPIVLPGKINISGALLVSRHLPRSTKLKLDIHAKMIGALWMPIPCISDYGSCTYDNFCDLLRGVMFSKCDRDMENKGITCDCPIPTGLFTVPTQSITVTKEQVDKIPVWDSLVSGQYWIKVEILDVYERPMGCFTVQLEVDVNSDKKKRSLRIRVESNGKD